jgi:hypothetical protein
MAYGDCPYDVGLYFPDMINVSRPFHTTPERYMSRTIRYAVLALAVAAATACSSSITEPTAAQKCTAKSANSSQSCVSMDFINPKV